MPSLQSLLQEMGYDEVLELIEHLAIPDEDIAISDEVIGEGTFGIVRKGTLTNDERQNQEVAVKVLKSKSTSTRDMMRFFQEGLILHNLDHENILRIIGISIIDNEPLLVFPFMKGGNLKQHFQNNQSVSATQRMQFCQQVCNAMAFLELKKCLHRDLAARNVLLDDNLMVKLSDFGLAYKLEGSDYYKLNTRTTLPIRWYPPESLQTPFTYTSKSDVWAFGVTCWEIFELPDKCEPYEGVPSDTLITMICNGYKLDCPNRCPPLLQVAFQSLIFFHFFICSQPGSLL